MQLQHFCLLASFKWSYTELGVCSDVYNTEKMWQQEPGKSTWETAWVMNERCIASQIRFVFQSSSSHIPYWLKPNNLVRCSPPPFASSSFFLSLSPERNDLPVLLSLLKKSWQQITLPDLKVEPLILMISINHDKDIKKRELAGLYILPTIKRYYLATHT